MSYAAPPLRSSEKMDWRTPPAVFAAAEEHFGQFDLDVAASAENALCKRYIDKARDAFRTEWEGRNIWCNPPYGRGLAQWAKRAVDQARNAPGSRNIVMLVPSRTDTKWFRQLWDYAESCLFIHGRLKFLQDEGDPTPAPFPSVLLQIGGGGIWQPHHRFVDIIDLGNW